MAAVEDIVRRAYKAISWMSTAKSVRDDMGILLRQLEGLAERLQRVRAMLLKRDRKDCAANRLLSCVATTEREVVEMFGSTFMTLLTYSGPRWYITELSRLEAALGAELGIYAATAGDTAGARCSEISEASLGLEATEAIGRIVEVVRKLPWKNVQKKMAKTASRRPRGEPQSRTPRRASSSRRSKRRSSPGAEVDAGRRAEYA